MKRAPHFIQINREISVLHLRGKNLLKVGALLMFAEYPNCNSQVRIIGRIKKWESLNVIPVEMTESNKQIILVGIVGEDILA